MVSARPQVEAACQLQEFCWSSTVGVQRACTSPTSVRFTRPAPDVLWRDWPDGLGAGLWLQFTRVRFSHLAPNWADRIRGLPTACNREMRGRVSHRPPSLARELDGRVVVWKGRGYG